VTRAQFRDTVMMRGSNGTLMSAPAGASVSLFDVGTTTRINEKIYADDSSGTLLSNPLTPAPDGTINFWLDEERELDVEVACFGFATVRVTVTTDGPVGVVAGPAGPQGPQGIPGPVGPAGPAGPAGAVDHDLRVYVQHIMSIIDPSGPPPPSP